MTRRMLVDAAHSEEIRVVIVNDDKIEDFEVETSGKEQVKGNIYVAEVTRVEPSLQAAFVDYGGNRNGFLAFSEIHPQWFTLPEEEKASLMAELQEIADRRRKRTEEMEDSHEKELEAQSLETEPEADTINAKSGNEDKSEAEAKVDADLSAPKDEDKTSEAETESVVVAAEKADEKPKRGRRTRRAPKKDDKEEESSSDTKLAKAEAQAVSKKEDDADIEAKSKTETRKSAATKTDDLTEEEKAEDARALALATSMAETPLDDDDRGSRTRKRPRRHAKGKRSDEEKTSKSAEAVDLDKDIISEKVVKDVDIDIDDLDDDIVASERRQPIHRRYNIADVVKEGQKILIQVNKEERGNKGAAVSTYISLPGRFVVLMPNTPYAGGISRKITDLSARRSLKKAIAGIDIPSSMGMIVRTAGIGQEPANIERDVANLLNHWEKIEVAYKECTTRNKLVHEDGALIIRAARDMLSEDVEEINISGRRAYRSVKDYVKAIMPEMSKIVKEHRTSTPIFSHYGVETELTHLHRTRVELPSGGYLIINPTEALVSIDVNSGRATQEKNIEETAYKTNLEAAEEVCRQLRLRDLAGLIVIDFIDMEDRKNERNVEKAVRKAVKKDRARVQLAPISQFGLLEMSRQRLRPSLGENTSIACPHCNGAGFIPSLASAALMLLRGIEEEIAHTRAVKAIITTSSELAIYVLNHKRDLIRDMEARYKFQISLAGDNRYIAPDHKLELIHIDSAGTEKKTSQEIKMRQPSEEMEANKNKRRRRGGRGRGKNEGETESSSSSYTKQNTHRHSSPKDEKDSRDTIDTAEKAASPSRSNSSNEENRHTSRERDDKEGRRDRSRRTRRGRRGERYEKGERTPREETISTADSSTEKKQDLSLDSKPRSEVKNETSNEATSISAAKIEETTSTEAAKSTGRSRSPRRRQATKKTSTTETQTSDRLTKGITVETVDGTGTKKVEEASPEKSAVGKAFQRWWGKSSE